MFKDFCVAFLVTTLAMAARSQECDVIGSCIGTSLGTYPGVEEEGDCWQLCQDEPDCEYYTFDWTSGGFCFVFSTCPVIDDTCRTCSTSEDDCPLLSCQVPGECLGILLDEFDTHGGDDSECADACAAATLCRWRTYFSESGKCVLYNTCEVTEDNCDNCLTSEKECQSEAAAEGDILIVVKNYVPEGSPEEVSVLDLSDPERACDPIDIGPLSSDLMTNEQSLHGTFAGGDGLLLVCGYSPDECSRYDDRTSRWTDGPARVGGDRFLPYGLDMAGSDGGNGDGDGHWVSGGGSTEVTTEVFDGEEFQFAAELPAGISGHCAVDLGDGEAMVLSGDGMGNHVYKIDVSTGDATELSPLPSAEGENVTLTTAMCGAATRADGGRVVVLAGGTVGHDGGAVDDSYVYDVALDVWMPGARLPRRRTWGRAVQRGDSFLVVGGGSDSALDGAEMRGEILRYDPDGDSWEELPQRLEDPSFVMVALMAPQGFNASCS